MRLGYDVHECASLTVKTIQYVEEDPDLRQKTKKIIKLMSQFSMKKYWFYYKVPEHLQGGLYVPETGPQEPYQLIPGLPSERMEI